MSTIYTESFATNVSQPHSYKRFDALGSAAALSGYPYLVAGEAFNVSSGVLHVDTSGGEDSGVSGVAFRDFGPLSGGYWDGSSGCITLGGQQFSSANAAFNHYSPVITVTSRNGSTGGGAALLLPAAFVVAYNSGHWELEYQTFGHSGSIVATSSTPTMDNGNHDLQLEWQCAVPNSGFTDSDTSGFVKFSVDGAVVISATGIKLFASTYNGSGGGNWLSAVWLGYFGMLGSVNGPLVVKDSLCSLSPIFQNINCCNDQHAYWFDALNTDTALSKYYGR